MRRRSYQGHFGIDWPGLGGRLVYLPGAIILLYGGWLVLTI
jgi:hypothetical protein